MEIGFCISVYRDPVQFGRLVRTLAAIDCAFHVHVDARVDQGPFVQQVEALGARCKFVERRVPVAWGGLSQVRYQRELLQSACGALRPDDRVFLLSGADYPICSAEAFVARVAQTGDRLRAAPIFQHESRRARDRYRLLHMRDLDLRWPPLSRAGIVLVREASRLAAGRRDRPLVVDGAEWQIYVGSSYLGLTVESARYALSQLDQWPEIWRYFRYSFVPEEMLWQTILLNSPLRDRFTIVEDTLALPELSATHHFVYDPQVEVIDRARLDSALASGKLFARKFATGPSDSALDYLDAIWAGGSGDRQPERLHSPGTVGR